MLKWATAIGESVISLSEKCDYKEIYHELFHTLGFFHEQNRFDRDDQSISFGKILMRSIGLSLKSSQRKVFPNLFKTIDLASKPSCSIHQLRLVTQ